jgi:hypothetical protein
MVTPVCTQCGKVIPSDQINVANDLAFCRPCNAVFKLSELADDGGIGTALDLNRPPHGVWYRSEGRSHVIGATHRSWGAALGTLAVSLFWNGIVSIFVLLATAGTLSHLGVQVPLWFPAPKMNGSPMTVGMLLFLWLFLTPFILIGLTMIGAFLLALGGRTEVTIHNAQGSVFTGIGPLGYRRRFDASGVRQVRLKDKQGQDGQSQTEIVIEPHEGKLIKFGSSLPEERRQFIAAALRQALQ